MFEYKCNVIYLLDNITNVTLMDSPDIYKIKLHLQSLTQDDIYMDKVIPIFTEDDEARVILDMLLNYFSEIHPEEFRGINRFFHFVHANIGAENLIGIFTDSKLLRTTIRSICILDGDHNSDMSNCILALPGNDCPEEVLFSYAQKLYEEDDCFWTQSIIIEKGFGKIYYLSNIKTKIDDNKQIIEQYRSSGQSTKGKRREFNKKLFNDNLTFFKLLYKHWLHNIDNQECIEKFYNNFRSLFKKMSHYQAINPNEWK